MFFSLFVALFALFLSSTASPCRYSPSDSSTPSTYSPSPTPSSTPTDTSSTPAYTPSTPAYTPSTPAYTPSTPAYTPSTPTPTPSSTPPASVAAPASDANTGGVATYFYQDNTAGACGTIHLDSDFICAMDQALFGTSYPSLLCGKQVQITNTDTGATVTVTVADDCPTCNNANSIDLSVAAFQALSGNNLGLGELPSQSFHYPPLYLVC
ncbi:barwin-like endoglucanase [Imleria badia]|nr:barwin-like endoglucanase [Imleria badia]